MGFAREDQETVLVFEVESGQWNVYSNVPKHIRKLMNLGDMSVLELEEGRPIAIRGTLSEKNVSMKKIREMSEEQREAQSARMKDYHNKKEIQLDN
jgi:hypothetical protein